jgi:hypothetical protein
MGESSEYDATADAKKKQTKKKGTIKGTQQFHINVEFEHLLRTILVKPQLWLQQQFQYLRNFVLTVSHGKDRHKFRPVEGDAALTVAKKEESSTTITKNFIQTLANGDNIPDDIEPVLFVLMRKTGFHDHMAHRDYKKQKVKLTHLTLVDGDNNTIHCYHAIIVALIANDDEVFYNRCRIHCYCCYCSW